LTRRALDLVTLRFGIHAVTADPSAAARLDRQLDDLPAQVLAPTWTHLSLRMTDWAIRHSRPAEVELWLGFAEQRAR
jgi:hypothetical protein